MGGGYWCALHGAGALRRFHPDDALFLFAPFTWAGTLVLVPILLGTSLVLPVVTIVTTWRYLRLRRARRAV